MADSRKITIEILGGDGQQNSSGAEGKLEQTVGKIINPMKNKGLSQNAQTILLNQAFEQVKKLTIQAADLTINRFYTLSEDYIGQTNYNNIRTLISKGTGFITSVAGGAIAGGPAGAIISGIGYIGSEFISNQAALSSRYQELNAANINIEFSRKRSGLYDEGRGTEN